MPLPITFTAKAHSLTLPVHLHERVHPYVRTHQKGDQRQSRSLETAPFARQIDFWLLAVAYAISTDLRPDAAVLAFAAALGCATALLFGLLPALGSSVIEGELAGHRTSGERGARAAGRVLIAGQLAVSLLLLIGAGLFLGTLRNLRNEDLGFRPDT